MAGIELTMQEKACLVSILNMQMHKPEVLMYLVDTPGNRILYTNALKYQDWPTDLTIEKERIVVCYQFLVAYLLKIIEEDG